MSLRRRNVIAWIMLMLAAVGWLYGQRISDTSSNTGIYATTASMQETRYAATMAPTMESSHADLTGDNMTDVSIESAPDRAGTGKGMRALGFMLSFSAYALAIVAIFVLWQQSPILGPDGVAVLPGVTAWIEYELYRRGSRWDVSDLLWILLIFTVLVSVRELWGWIRAKCGLSWCLLHRVAKRCPTPQMSLTIMVGWIFAAVVGVVFFYIQYTRYIPYRAPMIGMILGLAFGIGCLWKYGSDISHFEKQLDNFRKGLPIAVKDGAFTETEAQLLEVQAQHEEAIRAAVTSERFKVELISNVSHDLRTPLTAILGYGELLKQESLSPSGQEQLTRLNRKAGYMRDLVEALFELTKVSSGVIESRREEIDLIRLLEQTVGLFDDQLSEAGLSVRRHYSADAVPVITDGSMMHQVFANLLSNAIKYALKGTRIHLEVKEDGDGYRIRMINTSSYEMDFTPEEIVQRFARGDKARSTKGSGLGLAIAQTYTESVGGQFTVTVDGDQFSAIVWLPRAIDENRAERNL